MTEIIRCAMNGCNNAGSYTFGANSATASGGGDSAALSCVAQPTECGVASATNLNDVPARGQR